MSHRTRAPLASRYPAHVTVRLGEGLPTLRRKARDLDHYASGPWFDGFRERFTVRGRPPERPVRDPHTWLLRVGWRRHGLIRLAEVPGG